MYVCKLLTQIQCVGPCLDILTIIKRFVATGSVEVARASTGKLRNERKTGNQALHGFGVGHYGLGEAGDGHPGHGEDHQGLQNNFSDTRD